MTRRIEFNSAASLEIEQAGDWLEARRRGLGRDFVTAVAAAIDSAAEWPNAGQQVAQGSSGTVVRRAPIERFPYYIAYTASDDELVIVAVAHDRRRPRYWIGRIDPGTEKRQ